MGRTIFIVLCFSFLPSITFSTTPFDPNDIIFHYHGADTGSHAGGQLDGIGDVNSDGYDDIALWSDIPYGTLVFFGGEQPDSIFDMVLRGHWGSANNGDLNGDGIDEVITSSMEYIFFYRGYGDSLASQPYDSIAYSPPLDGHYPDVNIGLVDADSLGDILTLLHNTPGGPTAILYLSEPSFDSIPDWSYNIQNNSHILSDVGLIDFDGDHNLDIYLGMQARLEREGYVYLFLGPSFGADPDIVIGYPVEHDSLGGEYFAEHVAEIGDFDGDGWDDLAVRFFAHPLVYRCGPEADTVFDYWLTGTYKHFAAAGDIDADGYDDFLGGCGRVMDGVVDLYLGGPDADTMYDLSIYRGYLPPLFLMDLGYRVSSAGDFNGDGIDDFMFSCRNFAHGHPGDVFVVKGSQGIVTAVTDENHATLPVSFTVRQNYPNPFNLSTTIEFQLPKKTEVNLTVYNILGKKVKVLLDKSLSAGSYRIPWDGRDEMGEVVSSGIYLYKLSGDGYNISKKMVLLK